MFLRFVFVLSVASRHFRYANLKEFHSREIHKKQKVKM